MFAHEEVAAKLGALETQAQGLLFSRVRAYFGELDALRVRFMLPGRRLGEPVPCRAKDISLTGICFYVPPDPPTRQVVVELDTPFVPPLTVPARIVRTRPAEDGWCEIGAAFS